MTSLVSGPVCGQDPRYCSSPRSSYTDTWADNMTSWPVCLSSAPTSGGPGHVTCEVIARPCCIGIHGKCEMRTREYCDLVSGHFHPEASLCSQASKIRRRENTEHWKFCLCVKPNLSFLPSQYRQRQLCRNTFIMKN